MKRHLQFGLYVNYAHVTLSVFAHPGKLVLFLKNWSCKYKRSRHYQRVFASRMDYGLDISQYISPLKAAF